MIGRPEWFRRRKYGGWGISPKTWQGWVYVVLMIGPFVLFQSLPYWDDMTRIYVTIVWLIVLGLDVVHIMVTLHRDEREFKIEALAERNASWVMVLVLVAGVLYQVWSSAMSQDFAVDPFIFAALIGGALAKTASNIFYDRRGV